MTNHRRSLRSRAWLGAALPRAALFALAWMTLAEGQAKGWAIPLLGVAAATLASLALLPPGRGRWRLPGLLRFLPFFLHRSVHGGIDVARRALDPRLPIDPGPIVYTVRLPAGAARTFFAGVLGLLPGTLGTELRGRRLRVHALDRRLPVAATLRELEERVADLFGVPLAEAADARPDGRPAG